jgi:hypothetical protein
LNSSALKQKAALKAAEVGTQLDTAKADTKSKLDAAAAQHRAGIVGIGIAHPGARGRRVPMRKEEEPTCRSGLFRVHPPDMPVAEGHCTGALFVGRWRYRSIDIASQNTKCCYAK